MSKVEEVFIFRRRRLTSDDVVVVGLFFSTAYLGFCDQIVQTFSCLFLLLWSSIYMVYLKLIDFFARVKL